MTITVQALDHLVVQVSDVGASAKWYAQVLGMTREDFRPEPGKPPRTAMPFGRQKINLRPITERKEDWFTADHEAVGSEDLCFLTDSTPDQVVQHLRALGVAIVTGPGARQGARGVLMSVYCRDPDGSLIEIASYLEVSQPQLAPRSQQAEHRRDDLADGLESRRRALLFRIRLQPDDLLGRHQKAEAQGRSEAEQA
jgi:catechol 2,3-dioxygenase-like lactoylglutathione lyase family enzyme